MNASHILYDFLPSGNSYKIRLLLRQLGIPFEYRPIDIIAGDSRQPWFLQKNPMGQVPVLELPDGTCLRESSAILMHIAEGTPYLPEHKLTRTRILEWLCFEQSNIDQVIARARFRRMYPHVIPTRPEEFEAWYRHGERALQVIDSHLAGRSFLVDERYTIADIAVYAYTHCSDQGGFNLGPYANLKRWFDRVAAMPRYIPIGADPRTVG